MINNNILALINKTPASILEMLTQKIKARRLERNWTQKYLADRSGVTLSSYRRFETTGEISLHSFVKIAAALEIENDFETLFNTRIYESIEDVLAANEGKKRQRGRNRE